MENARETEQQSDQDTKPRGKFEISVVEGSFRRIAGIREFADDSRTYVVRVVEILREPGESLGFYIRQGDGWDRSDGVFVSRVNLGSIVETNGLLSIGDEITKVNDIDVTDMPLESVATIMRYVKRLFLTVKVLTSPALVRTLSRRSSNHTRPDPNCPDGTVNLRPRRSGDREVSARNRRARVIPASTEGLVPYAYTRIGPETHDDDDSPGYETVRHEQLRIGRSSEAGGNTADSPRTLGGGEERAATLIDDHDSIDQSYVSEPHSGQLTLVLDTVDNLIPLSDDAPLVCSVSCDSEPTVEVSIADTQLKQEGVAKMNHEYHIQLTANHKISFRLVNGLLSSVKTIPFAYFLPTPQTPRSLKDFALTLSPIGRLCFSLGFSPLPLAIPRWGNSESTHTGGLRGALSASSGLPLVVERAIRVVEEYGIETPGLYTLTADQEVKREALAACESDTLQLSLLRSLVSRLTVHAFTGVLKDFLLHLPQPIFSPEFTTSLQNAVYYEPCDRKHVKVNNEALLSSVSLPDGSHTIAGALLAHFRAVCQHGATNGTNLDKISQVFAPLLFTPAHNQGSEQSVGLVSHEDFTRHANILKTLVLHYNM